MATDYERLKEDGYEEEEIVMKLDDPLSEVSLTDAPMAEGREDKSATISDSQGHSMKTSNVMMGYNRKGLNLPSGVYVSADELESAMTTFLTEDSENKTIVCRSTGAVVDVSTLTSTVIEALVAMPGVTLTGKSDKITNQTAYTYGIRGDDKATRVFMAGNKGFQLPNGEYVSEEELQGAMSDYFYMTKKEEPPIVVPPIFAGGDDEIDPPVVTGGGEDPVPPPSEEKEEEEEKHTVVGRRGWSKWQTIAIAVGTALIVFLASLGLDDVIIQKYVTETNQKATYSVSEMSEEHVYESVDEAIQRAMSEFETGDTVHIEEGVRYDHESDKVTDKHGIIGEGLREEGDYTLEYISVLDGENKIIEVEFEEGKNVGEVVQQALEERGLSLNDVQVRVHIGGPVAGWIDMNDILSEESITPQLIESKFVVESVHQGTQDNFDGTLDVATPNGTVGIDVTNPDGTIVDDGTLVVGDNGVTYKVNDVEVTETTITTTYEENQGKKLTISLDNLIEHAAAAAIAEALLVGGVVALGAAINKKKEDEEKGAEAKANQEAEEAFASTEFNGNFAEVVAKIGAMQAKKDAHTPQPPADTLSDENGVGGIKR